MRTELLSCVLAALALSSNCASAQRTSAMTTINTFNVQVLDLAGNLSPAAVAEFTGDSIAGSRWTNVPPPSPWPGPPGWDGFEEPLNHGVGAFGAVHASSEVGFGGWDAAQGMTYFGYDQDAGLSEAGGSPDFGVFNFLQFGGSGFTLTPYSKIVITADFTMSAEGPRASANALLRFTGADSSIWYRAVTSGTQAYSVTASFINETAFAESGTFQGYFSDYAPATTAVPEPGTTTLLLIALTPLGYLLRRRRLHGA